MQAIHHLVNSEFSYLLGICCIGSEVPAFLRICQAIERLCMMGYYDLLRPAENVTLELRAVVQSREDAGDVESKINSQWVIEGKGAGFQSKDQKRSKKDILLQQIEKSSTENGGGIHAGVEGDSEAGGVASMRWLPKLDDRKCEYPKEVD